MPKDNNIEYRKIGAGSHILSCSPYVGGRKMSSSLINKLKRYNSTGSVQLAMPAQEYSSAEIEKAMNETPAVGVTSDPVIIKLSTYLKEDTDLLIYDSDSDIEILFIEGEVNTDSKLNNEPSDSSKGKKKTSAISIENILKNATVESVLETYEELKMEFLENQDQFKKLKLVQKHHAKNSHEELLKWFQMTLKKLYDLMPQPRSIRFETFLIFLEIDLAAVKYNPETDSFT